MDVIRSCYEADMVLVEGQAPVRVRWFRVDKHAPLFPGPHLFGSSVWDDPKADVDVGEKVPLPKVWANGMRPAGLWGLYSVLGNFDDFRTGSGQNPLSLAVSCVSEPVECIYQRFENGKPVEEGNAPSNAFIADGGVRFGVGLEPGPGEVCSSCGDFPLDPICGCSIPDKFTLFLHNVSGASLMEGMQVEMTKDPNIDCLWSGVSDNPYDSLHPIFWEVLNALDSTAIPWVVQFGTDPLILNDGQQGQDDATCKPFYLAWNNSTCSMAGPFATISVEAA